MMLETWFKLPGRQEAKLRQERLYLAVLGLLAAA
jgi:hypothetical protein